MEDLEIRVQNLESQVKLLKMSMQHEQIRTTSILLDLMDAVDEFRKNTWRAIKDHADIERKARR